MSGGFGKPEDPVETERIERLKTGAVEPHLIPVVTDRGFTHMPSVQGTYGELVRVYESSAASQPCIWLRIIGGQHDEWAAHLPVEAALRLADQIQYLASNHYQLGEGR